MGEYTKVLMSSVIESLIFTVVSAAVAAVGVLALRVPFFDGLGFVLLVVSSALMLIGGALSFITPPKAKVISQLTGRKLDVPDEAEKSQHKAALYVVTGVILFAESLLLASLALSGI